MMTDAADAARLVVEQTTEHAAQKTAEHATMLTQAMTSITDVRICAAEKIVDNAATQRHIVVKKNRVVAATSSVVATDLFLPVIVIEPSVAGEILTGGSDNRCRRLTKRCRFVVLFDSLFHVSGVEVLRVVQLRAVSARQFVKAPRPEINNDFEFIGPIIADLDPALGPDRPQCGLTHVLASAVSDLILHNIEPFVYDMVALSMFRRLIIACGYLCGSPDIYPYVLEVLVRDLEWVC